MRLPTFKGYTLREHVKLSSFKNILTICLTQTRTVRLRFHMTDFVYLTAFEQMRPASPEHINAIVFDGKSSQTTVREYLESLPHSDSHKVIITGKFDPVLIFKKQSAGGKVTYDFWSVSTDSMYTISRKLSLSEAEMRVIQDYVVRHFNGYAEET